MKKRFLLLLTFTFFFLPFISYSTHIVGGSLTYDYQGGSTYIVTLKLYRDCAGINLPANVTITVVGYNGAAFSPSKNFTMPRGTVTPVPSNLDTCAEPPNPMPCVQEGIYTATVTNLPPNPGGYHLYCQIEARNNSLSNVVNPGNTGSSFYAYIPGSSAYWIEDFNLANGTTLDNGATAWSISNGTTSVNTAEVNNGLFEVTGADDGEITWTSQVITISGYPGGVSLMAELTENATLEANDSILVYYSLDGGALTLFPTNGFFADDFTNGVSRATGLIGNTIQIIIRIHYSATSPNGEIYRFDNVIVHGDDFVPNDNPVFNIFPPLFLCAGEAFTFDHSATDGDGDSLAYSFYTPYDGDNASPGAKDPTFSNNIASFSPITWVGGFSASNPLGSPLSLNAITGLLSGTPGMIGQFVVGVKVKEYRNGVLLSETLRDFQFNVVNCPPLAQADLNPFNGCNGNPVSFSPLDTAGSDFWWDFGDLTATDDTSNLEFPSYNYPSPGTYTVMLIANKGTYCADTAITTVTTSSVSANFTHNAPKCIGTSVTFTDNSTKSSNATINGWTWNFGDGSTSVSQNPVHTYTASGVFTVSLTTTTNLGCDSLLTKTVTINAQPTANAGASQTICANNAAVILNGSVTNAIGGTWTSSGTGAFSPDNTTLNATYTPSNADTTAGLLTLTLTSSSNGACNAASDTMRITITDAPTTANAGVDQVICGVTTATLSANNPSVGTGVWSIVSGGGAITNPNSPTTTVTGLSAGSSYTYRWTISKATCLPSTDDVTINVDLLPTTSNAGPDQIICATTATLAANTPVVGTGAWSVITGTATVTTPTSPGSGVSGLVPGDSVTLRWTISQGVCSSTDDVKIKIDNLPTVANAGIDQTLCGVSTATISANTPAIGTGVWSVVSGTTTISNPNAATTTISGLTAGSSYTLRWTISNGVCPPSTDDVLIVMDLPPSMADAGTDQTICVTTATLTATTPLVGTGAWTVISGGATVTTPNSPSSAVTGLTQGVANVFRWTVSNSTCAPTTDDVTVFVDLQPSPANAGIDQTLCGVSTTTISANTPAIGTGVWSVVSGTTTISNPNAATTTISGLTAGSSYTLRWTISNGVCPPATDDVLIVMDLPPSIADAGADTTLCALSSTSINGNIPTVGTGIWTVVSGGGTITNPNSPSTTVTGLTQGAANVFRWTITNSSCAPSSDDVIIYVDILPTLADAGPDQIICGLSTATLTANVPAVGTGEWSIVSGSATIVNPDSITTQITGLSPGLSYTFRWTISATCPYSIDEVTIYVDSMPTTANAGVDQFLCNRDSTIIIANTPVVGIGAWTAVFGNPIINSPSNTTTAITGLSPGDSVILRWTITKGFCSSSDDISIVIHPITTTANSGIDQTVCSTSSVQLNGIISGITTTGTWSTLGSGIFSPSADTLNCNYDFSANDITTGNVMLVLTTTNNGPCPSVMDTLQISIELPASVNAGPDQSVCANDMDVSLAGTVSGLSSTGIWTSTGDGLFSSTTNLNSIYTPGSNDQTNSTFKLILSSTNNSNCPAVSDTLSVTITPSPIVAAGPDQLACSSMQIQLSGLVSGGSTTGNWTTLGTGSFSPDTTSLNGIYIPSNNDLTAGQVKLILTSVNNGKCLAVEDTLTITFFEQASVKAGNDQTICSSLSSISLSGTISGGTTSGAWSTNGTGNILPNASSLNASYTVSQADIDSGGALFILTSSANGPCPAISDTMILNIMRQPSVFIGDTSKCSKYDSVPLIGIVDGDTNAVKWISSGTGVFMPNDYSNPIYYLPSPSDLSNGTVSIKFISANSMPCLDDTSTMILTLLPSADASFTPSKYVCFAPADPVSFANSSTGSTTYTWNFGDGSTTTQTSPAHTFKETGKYVVTLIADNTYGCADTTSAEITVTGNIIFPTAFTPSADGPNGGKFNPNEMNNNIFFPYAGGIVEFHMMIFNRWGELIFESTDIDTGWDGYYRDVLCQQDTYVWQAEAVFNDGRTFNKKGSVTLLR